jgi:dTDP-L-rhamnose 4-epimerase
MRKILITGGGGLIGQAIALEHLKNGDDVYIYDTRLNPYNDYSNIIGYDLTSKGSIEQIIKNGNFNIISHQASHVGVGESQYNINKYTENNILFTSRLLQTLADTRSDNLHKFILAGSMGPYGEGPYNCSEHNLIYPFRNKSIRILCPICSSIKIEPLAIDENCLKHPKSIYGLTKLTQEEMVRIFSEIYGISSVSLRYFSVYGPQSNPTNPFTGVLSVIGNKIINSKEVYLYEDGDQTRDLISSTDIARAHYLSTTVQFSNNFEPFNIGTNYSISLKEVALKMLKSINIDKKIVFNNIYRTGDIKHSKANITKFSTMTGWKPLIDINQAINEYSNFLKENWSKFTTELDTSEVEHLNLKSKGIV